MKTIKINGVAVTIDDTAITNMSTEVVEAIFDGQLDGEFLDQETVRESESLWAWHDASLLPTILSGSGDPGWVCFKLDERHCDPHTDEWIVFTDMRFRSVVCYHGDTVHGLGHKTGGLQVRDFPLVISVDDHRSWLEQLPLRDDLMSPQDPLVAHGDILVLHRFEDNELHYESTDFSEEREFQQVELDIGLGDALALAEPLKIQIYVSTLDVR